MDSGVARISKDKKRIKKDALNMIKRYARFEKRFFKKIKTNNT